MSVELCSVIFDCVPVPAFLIVGMQRQQPCRVDINMMMAQELAADARFEPVPACFTEHTGRYDKEEVEKKTKGET